MLFTLNVFQNPLHLHVVDIRVTLNTHDIRLFEFFFKHLDHSKNISGVLIVFEFLLLNSDHFSSDLLNFLFQNFKSWHEQKL